MAGPGTTPKPPGEKVRRNVEHREVLPDSGPAEHPDLVGEFSAGTRGWFLTWATSPQATKFLATDWQRLQMLAPLVERYFMTGSVDALKELRIQESLLGATVVDRLRLKWDVEPVEVKAQPAKKRDRGGLRIVAG